jgi:hypothetical protein
MAEFIDFSGEYLGFEDAPQPPAEPAKKVNGHASDAGREEKKSSLVPCSMADLAGKACPANAVRGGRVGALGQAGAPLGPRRWKTRSARVGSACWSAPMELMR